MSTAPEIPDYGDEFDKAVAAYGFGTSELQDRIGQDGDQLNKQRDEGTK